MFSSFAKSLWIRGAITLVSAVNLLAAPPARAAAKTWPAAFRAEQMPVSDGNQYVPVGGSGAGVALLHGLAIPATCGCRSQKRWRRISP